MEVIYEHHTPRHPDPVPYWRAADLVLQHELGVWPQRRAKLGRLGLGHSVADWSDLTRIVPIPLTQLGTRSCKRSDAIDESRLMTQGQVLGT